MPKKSYFHLIHKQLTGEQSRRINAAFVMTRIFERINKNGKQGLTYRPQIVCIERDNPRTLI